MARTIVDYTVDMDMTTTAIDPPFVFSLAGIDELTFDVSSSTMIAWVTSTLTFEVCNNLARGNWQNPASGAVTLTAVGITASVSVTPYQWGRLRVTSSAASTFRATVNIHGEGGS